MVAIRLKTKPKQIICIIIEFTSLTISFGNQHGCSFFALRHQHGHRDVRERPYGAQQREGLVKTKRIQCKKTIEWSLRNKGNTIEQQKDYT